MLTRRALLSVDVVDISGLYSDRDSWRERRRAFGGWKRRTRHPARSHLVTIYPVV